MAAPGCRRLRRSASAAFRTATAPVVLAVLLAIGATRGFAEPLRGMDSFEARFTAADLKADTASPATSAGIAGDQAATPQPAAPPAADARGRYRALIAKEATQLGLAPEIAEAVMAVESGYNPDAIGGVGEIGLMQILPSTARMLGFSGTLADLAVPETNIHYGVTYLAAAWRLAAGDLCTAVMKYRAGHGETRFSFLSVNYCLAVRSKLLARGFHVTGNVPVATFGEPGAAGGSVGRGCGRKCLGASRIGSINIAALNTRLAALVVQARGGH
jgi:soluble lytic murein transglycosylase-like protein